VGQEYSARFDEVIDRTSTSSSKWEKYAGQDILPFWVADMDFPAPEFVLAAVRERLEHEIIGYTRIPTTLVEAFQGWLQRTYNWTIPNEWLVWIPGVVTGFNLAARAVAQPGGSILIPTPVYYPFLEVPEHVSQTSVRVPLVREVTSTAAGEATEHWAMDFDALQTAITPNTRLFMLCNPQNPTGRVYRKTELVKLADFCLEHGLYLCSDEIHASIILDESVSHIPIASLSPEIADRTISLFAPSKVYNIPGIPCAVAVIPNFELRHLFTNAREGLVSSLGPLAMAAGQAAFADQSNYVPELLSYLRGNHQRLLEVVGERMTPVAATYLAWIDFTDTAIANRPGAYFESFGLGLSDGAAFDGAGFVRFNFACPRSLLDRGLERYEEAVANLG
jgi:cystathionine beta-lyase